MQCSVGASVPKAKGDRLTRVVGTIHLTDIFPDNPTYKQRRNAGRYRVPNVPVLYEMYVSFDAGVGTLYAAV